MLKDNHLTYTIQFSALLYLMHESLGFSVWFGKLSYLENDKKYMLSYHVKINHICCVHNMYLYSV